MKLKYVLALFRTYTASEAEAQLVRTRGYASSLKTDIGTLVVEAKSMISALETKNGVLLTHISMMIAITGLMLAFSSDSALYETVLTLELVFYLMLALVCIRGQFHFDTDELTRKTEGDSKWPPHHYFQAVLFGELYYREKLFRFVQRSLYLLTFCLIATVIYGLLADELGLLTGETQ